MKKPTTAQGLLAFAFIMGCLNDFAFMAASGTYGVYLADYGLKLIILAVLLGFMRKWPVAPERQGNLAFLAVGCAALVAVGVLTDPWVEILGSGWKLFSWPPIDGKWLYLFDLTFGLALTAVTEELAFRRIALTVLPGSERQRIIVSSLLFGLIHWGQGYGQVIVAAIVGLAFAAAYLRTGSLWMVMLAHYLVDLVLFF